MDMKRTDSASNSSDSTSCMDNSNRTNKSNSNRHNKHGDNWVTSNCNSNSTDIRSNFGTGIRSNFGSSRDSDYNSNSNFGCSIDQGHTVMCPDRRLFATESWLHMFELRYCTTLTLLQSE
jgi:hypothetical protein